MVCPIERVTQWVVHGVPLEKVTPWVVHGVPHREDYSMGGPWYSP